MRPSGPGHGLPDFSAAVGAFIDEVDRRHVPMRLDVSHIHRQQPDAAGADNRGDGEIFVMLNVGWHIALLRSGSELSPIASLLPGIQAPSSTLSNI